MFKLDLTFGDAQNLTKVKIDILNSSEKPVDIILFDNN